MLTWFDRLGSASSAVIPARTNEAALDVKAEIDDVAFLHDVVLAFESQQSLFAGGCVSTCTDQIVVADDLGADEPARDVGMNCAGGTRPRLGCCHRIRASALRTTPVRVSTFGW